MRVGSVDLGSVSEGSVVVRGGGQFLNPEIESGFFLSFSP